MYSRMLRPEDLSKMRSRRTATVTQSAAAAAWQACMSSRVAYLPVPTIRRERRVCGPILKEGIGVSMESAASDHDDDFDAVAGEDGGGLVVGSDDDFFVAF